MNESANTVIIKLFHISRESDLLEYLLNLSTESTRRFGPHLFTAEEIKRLFHDPDHLLFIAEDDRTGKIVAYTIVKKGWVSFDAPRLSGYGLSPQPYDYTIAPSVSDEWQGKGIGSRFLQHILNMIKASPEPQRIFLWGGVQDSNTKAKRLYRKFGFVALGEFEHRGKNLDMYLVP